MAAAFGVTANTWARGERGSLALHPAYQVLLDLVEQRARRDPARVAAQLRGSTGVRALW